MIYGKEHFVSYCLFKPEIMIYGLFILNSYSKNYLWFSNYVYDVLRYIKCQLWNIFSINIKKCLVATSWNIGKIYWVLLLIKSINYDL